MFGIEVIPFKTTKGKSFFFNKRKIEMGFHEIEELLKKNDFLKQYDETTKQNQEAYSYIQDKRTINENNMKKVYDMISKTIENKEYFNEMGPLYRKGEVCILNHGNSKLIDLLDFDKGVPAKEVESHMKELFAFTQEKTDTLVDAFLYSQIIHFYFVYIHPYYDGNGRSARLLSSWYLKNHRMSPFSIFLRGIEFTKEEYLESIRKSRKGNLTPFLEYMTKTVKKEMEKEIILNSISGKHDITEEERKVLFVLLSTNKQTLVDLLRIKYIKNMKNIPEIIISLQEKGIVEQKDGKLDILVEREKKSKEYRR